jgi:hypothetical protein
VVPHISRRSAGSPQNVTGLPLQHNVFHRIVPHGLVPLHDCVLQSAYSIQQAELAGYQLLLRHRAAANGKKYLGLNTLKQLCWQDQRS